MSERRRVPVSRGRKKKPAAQPVPAAAPVPEPEPDAAAAQCNCPRLDPEEWHEAESDWSDLPFVTTSVLAVLGVPIGFAGLRPTLERKAAKAGASVPDDPMLLLGGGRFRRRVMLEVEVEGAARRPRGVKVPGGIAYSRLVPAPWGEMQRVVNETKDAARRRYGLPPNDIWVWYLTCRECSTERNFETLVVAHYRDLA
jgi:hypothetical protein